MKRHVLMFLAAILLHVPACLTASASTRLVFVLDPQRTRDTLERDAALIMTAVESAKSGDRVEVVTTASRPVLDYTASSGLNPMRRRQAQVRARNTLRAFFLPLFDHGTKDDTTDMALTLKSVFDRLNTGGRHERDILVLLSSGLQHAGGVSWRGCTPSDSWVKNFASPFATVPSIRPGTPTYLVMLPQPEDFVDLTHGQAIERWYSVFAHSRGAALVAFTYDHAAVVQLIRATKIEAPKRAPVAVDVDGELRLTVVRALTTE